MNPVAPVVVAVLFLIGLVLLVMLFLAPMKLYGIHREARRTNELLNYTNELLKYLGTLLSQTNERGQAQVQLMAALANKTYREEATRPTEPAIPATTLPHSADT
jgi:hypothetical protein